MELLLLVCLCLLSCSGDGQGLNDGAGRNNPASKPSITTLVTPGGMTLQCEVVGVSPKPKMEWRDSSGNVLPGKNLKETENAGLYTVVLQTDVTKSGTYRCEVTQKEIGVEVSSETYATFNGAAAAPGSNTGLLMLFFLLLLLF